MPTFDTPKPINVDLDLFIANVTITAEDRLDTVVTVNPTDPDNESDAETARQARVDHSHDTVTVTVPKLRNYVTWGNKSRSIDVSIVLPTGSNVSGTTSFGGLATLKATGRLGACEFKSGIGSIVVDHADSVRLRGMGDILVNEVDGDAELTTNAGNLRLGRAAGSLTVKNTNGPCIIGEAAGSTRVRASNGDIVIDRATTDVDAVASHGDIRVGEVGTGSVELKSAMGAITVGIPEGTAAWLEANTGFGAVRNELDSTGEPGPGDSTVKVSARTSHGDIVIHRSDPREGH